MNSGPEAVEIFYLDDMEDEVFLTEMNLRRQNIKLDIKFYLSEPDMLSALRERQETSARLPDIIVTDLNMPGKGGAHLVQTLRSDDAYQDVAIGVCTGSENPADHASALAAGADFVGVKPFNRVTLKQICETTARFDLVTRDDGRDYLCREMTASAAA